MKKIKPLYLFFLILIVSSSCVHASSYKVHEENESGKSPKLTVEVGGKKAEYVRKLLADPSYRDVIAKQGSKLLVEDVHGKMKITATDTAVELVKGALQGKEGHHRFGHHRHHGHQGHRQHARHEHEHGHGFNHGHHKFGMREKQHDETILPRGFSPAVYKFLNPDIAAAYGDDEKAVVTHYLKYGRKEGREYIPGGFSPKSYLLLNEDVAIEAKKHADPLAFAVLHRYILSPFENRPYLPRSFNAELYLKLNTDVAAVAQNASSGTTNFAAWHYLNHGRFEERPFDVVLPEGFSAIGYYQKNPDVLENALKEKQMNDGYAMKHYKMYGYFERRAY